MNSIIAAGAPIDTTSIFLLIIAIVAGYFVIKYKKVHQVLFMLSFIGSVLCLIKGTDLLSRHYESPSIAGAILITTGLGVMVSIGIVFRKNEDNMSS